MLTALELLRSLRSDTHSNTMLLTDNIDRIDNIEEVIAEFVRLQAIIIRLRCENPPKASRVSALAYLYSKIDALAMRCDISTPNGVPIGYTDPSDPFAENALQALRLDLTELEEGPYPLGVLDADPFAMKPSRLYSGQLAEC